MLLSQTLTAETLALRNRLAVLGAALLCTLAALPAAAQVVVTPAPGRHGGACLINRDGHTLCEGQSVITPNNTRLRIRQLFRDGRVLAEYVGGLYQGQSTRVSLDRLSPRVRCVGSICEGGLAITNSSNVLAIEEVYASGTTVARYTQGFYIGQTTTVAAHNLSAEVQCLADACQGDEALSRSGTALRINRLFENGRVQAEYLTGFYQGQQTTVNLHDLSIRVSSGRPPVVSPPIYDGGGGGRVVVTPPTAEGVRCQNRPCQVGLACIDTLPIGATRYNHVEARGIYRILGCAR